MRAVAVAEMNTEYHILTDWYNGCKGSCTETSVEAALKEVRGQLNTEYPVKIITIRLLRQGDAE